MNGLFISLTQLQLHIDAIGQREVKQMPPRLQLTFVWFTLHATVQPCSFLWLFQISSGLKIGKTTFRMILQNCFVNKIHRKTAQNFNVEPCPVSRNFSIQIWITTNIWYQNYSIPNTTSMFRHVSLLNSLCVAVIGNYLKIRDYEVLLTASCECVVALNDVRGSRHWGQLKRGHLSLNKRIESVFAWDFAPFTCQGPLEAFKPLYNANTLQSGRLSSERF